MTKPNSSVFIVAAKRTPIGGFNGSLSSLTAPQLGSIAIKQVIADLPQNTPIDQVLFGCVLSANLGQNPARQAALGAGLPNTVPCTTVNKVCASGMKAVMLAANAILSGESEIVVAGGMESMSNTPYYSTTQRFGSKYGHQELVDGIVKDGLFDVYNQFLMGNAAELCANKYGFSRKDQDDYAVLSYTRAQNATSKDLFASEIVPVQLPTQRGKPGKCVTTDDEVANFNEEKMRAVKPAFVTDGTGTVTAPNASTLSDGASALIIASASAVAKYGLVPIAELCGWADAATDPEMFTIAPSLAIPKALEKSGLKQSEIDLFELNEAFAVVALANCKILDISKDKVNGNSLLDPDLVNGGAVALGHPLGCSGARIIVTLIHALLKNSKKNGCAAVCNGGGGASAIVLRAL